MTADTFPGSKTLHGTHGGWAKHRRLGERPCDPCYRAKSEYDARRRSAPERRQIAGLRAEAQAKAYQRLAALHRDLYRALYTEECHARGLAVRR